MRLLVAYALGTAVVLISMAAPALASHPVPEIDASLLSTSLGLLTAGMLIVRSRRRK